MKVTVKEPAKKLVIKYPCLMKASDGLIVLFTHKEGGTVLSSDDEMYYDVGDYSESWNISSFEPYGGEVTITND